PKPDFSFGNICQQESATFTNASTISSGLMSYLWDFGNGTISTALNPQVTYTMAGTYDVKLVVTSSYGIRDSVTKQITVYPKPVAGFIVTDACEGEAVTFTDTSIYQGTPTYTWTFGDSTD